MDESTVRCCCMFGCSCTPVQIRRERGWCVMGRSSFPPIAFIPAEPGLGSLSWLGVAQRMRWLDGARVQGTLLRLTAQGPPFTPLFHTIKVATRAVSQPDGVQQFPAPMV